MSRMVSRALWIILAACACLLKAENDGAATNAAPCLSPEPGLIDISRSFRWHDRNCLRFDAGFSPVPGSFASVAYSRSNLLHFREVLTLSAEVGVRLRKVQFGLTKPTLFGKPIQTGFNVYGQRFYYNQQRESSIFELPRNMPVFDSFPPEDLLRYIRRGYGVTGFAEYRFRDTFSSVGLEYNYDISSFQLLTQGSYEYFVSPPDILASRLSGIRTAKLTPSFTYDTIDNATQPAKGVWLKIATTVTDLGASFPTFVPDGAYFALSDRIFSNVQSIEPSVVVKYFRPGFGPRHVIAMHFSGRVLVGVGYQIPPPYDRYYMGGENDVRGFDTWSISPIAYMPSPATLNVLNADGSPRVQKQIVNGVATFTNVTMQVPVYRPISVGGDTKVVANFEYRIPLRGPWTLALFNDAGWNALSFPDRLRLSASRVSLLNNQFFEAGFSDRFHIPRGVQMIRMSTGAELQVVTPKFHAPLRFYLAVNPLRVREDVSAILPFNRSDFQNGATYQEALSTLGLPTPIHERRFFAGFSVGRTF